MLRQTCQNQFIDSLNENECTAENGQIHEKRDSWRHELGEKGGEEYQPLGI